MEINLNELKARTDAEASSRVVNARRSVSFLQRVLSPEELQEPRALVEALAQLTLPEFEALLVRLNGMLNGTPVSKRALLPMDKHAKSAVPDSSLFARTEIVFPDGETRQELLAYAFEGIRALAQDPTEAHCQTIARTLFNTVIYLHPSPDGNGRTARTLYALTSPSMRTTSGRGEQLERLLLKRSEGLREWHGSMDATVFGALCEARGIEAFTTNGELAVGMQEAEDFGFDSMTLQFVGAYDAMSPEERERYAKREGEKLLFNEFDFPEELRGRIKVQMKRVRNEFARFIVKMSLDDAEYPPFFDEELTRILKG